MAARYTMRGTIKANLDNITDCFTGADGGVRFALLLGLVRELDAQASAGDAAAQKVLDVLTQFSRLSDVAAKAKGADDRG